MYTYKQLVEASSYMGREGAVDLGEYAYADGKGNIHRYALYALPSPRYPDQVSFGAQFGLEVSEYLSGEINGTETYVSGPTAVAAARYLGKVLKGEV